MYFPSSDSKLNSDKISIGGVGGEILTAGGHWDSIEIGHIKVYYYEGVNQEYNVPTDCCYVIAFRFSINRGFAIAYQWNGSADIYTNSLWDTWRGWVKKG